MGGIGFNVVGVLGLLIAFFAVAFLVSLPVTLGLWVVVWIVLRAARRKKSQTAFPRNWRIRGGIALLCMFAFIAVFLWLTSLIPWQAAVLYALVLNTPLSLFAIIAFCDHKQDMLHLAWLFAGVFVVTAATTVALSLLQQGVESDIQTFGVLSFMPAQGLMAVFVALGVLVFTQQRVARKS